MKILRSPRSAAARLSALLMTLLLPLVAMAQFSTTTSDPFADSGPTFLPVAEAYQPHVYIAKTGLLIDWDIAPGYYLYKHQFKLQDASGRAIELTIPDGKRKWDDYFQQELEVFYDQVSLSANVETSGSTVFTLTSQGCADAGLCYPPRSQKVEVDFNTGSVITTDIKPGSATATAPVASDEPTTLWYAIVAALLGGAILNLMPCVFPVLSIKVLSFTQQHHDGANKYLHGLIYTAGVTLTFVLIAATMLALRSGGEAIGWGFQLQSPIVITALTLLFFVMGLSFAGKISFGNRLASLASAGTNNESYGGSFATGVLASVVASPCTAPFMGAALGFAVTQPTAIALGVFAALGIGMAAPFVLLTWIPALANRLPRPGAWMEQFRQFLAFPLYLTCVWLMWVLANQIGTAQTALLGIALVLILVAVWIKEQNFNNVTARRGFTGLFLLLAAALVISAARPMPEQRNNWEPYSKERLSQLTQSGQPVFLNMTADWCITCLVNERVALSGESFDALLNARGVTYLKGDWTNYNSEITDLLAQFNRSGVPLYVYYPPNGNPTVLPQVLTFDTIASFIDK